jgi:hypothetical protein
MLYPDFSNDCSNNYGLILNFGNTEIDKKKIKQNVILTIYKFTIFDRGASCPLHGGLNRRSFFTWGKARGVPDAIPFCINLFFYY